MANDKIITFSVLSVAVVAILFGLSYFGVFGPASTAPAPTSNQVVQDGVSTIVTTNPTIDFAAVDKQVPGTIVKYTTKMSVDGGSWQTATAGTTTAVPGQKMKFLLTNNTVYHNLYIDTMEVSPTTFPVEAKFNKNATITENIYSTTGLVMTNGGGVANTNQTDLGSGVSYTWKDEMTGQAQKSTQDMTCVIELSAGVNASTSPQGVSMSKDGAEISLKSSSTPAWYSPASTNSRIWMFDLPALSSGATVTYYITLNTLSTASFPPSAYMKKSCYTKEYFIDSNTGLQYDVADSNNVVKSMDIKQYTAYFG